MYSLRGMQPPFAVGLQAQNVTRLKSLPGYFIFALLQHEDLKFFQHKGFHWSEIKRRSYNYLAGSGPRGSGSSITQQFARQVFLTSFSSLYRKIIETSLTIEIEALFSKEEILSLFLSSVSFGQHRIIGLPCAAMRYFNKSLPELTLDESMFLAQLIEAPTLRQSQIFNPNWRSTFNFRRAFIKYRDIFLYYYYEFSSTSLLQMEQIDATQAISALKKRTAFSPESIDPKIFNAIENRALRHVTQLTQLIDSLHSRKDEIVASL